MHYVECPRDSWQGLPTFIPTHRKVQHLNNLLNAGFLHLDLGSFVNPKAVPQMADTEAVLDALPEPSPQHDYLCIIANPKGLERSAQMSKVTSVGYPLSISNTFQLRNTNRSTANSWLLVQELQQAAHQAHKRLVVYLSMAFGNPYGDAWDEQIVLESIAQAREMGVEHIALADTAGTSTPEIIGQVCRAVQQHIGTQNIGLHVHGRPENAQSLLQPALDAGFRWFEGALGGVGGCPFAGDALVGNLPTEQLSQLLALPYSDIPLLAQQAKALQQTGLSAQP